MTNAQLVEKLLTLPPNDPATLSVKDATGLTTILPVLWIAKGSIYSKQTAQILDCDLPEHKQERFSPDF